MRTRRKGEMVARQPRLGARMCQGTFFFTLQWLFYIIHELMFVFAKEIFFFMTIECSQRVYSIVWFPYFF